MIGTRQDYESRPRGVKQEKMAEKKRLTVSKNYKRDERQAKMSTENVTGEFGESSYILLEGRGQGGIRRRIVP